MYVVGAAVRCELSNDQKLPEWMKEKLTYCSSATCKVWNGKPLGSVLGPALSNRFS